MIYHALPVIPEDDVLVLSHHNHSHHQCYSSTGSHRNGNRKNRYDHTNSSGSGSSNGVPKGIDDDDHCVSPFGYVAILRNDIILLEIRRSSSYQQQQHRDSMDDDEDNSNDAVRSALLLDRTIHGLLQMTPSPGWESLTYRLDDTSDDDDDTTTMCSDNPWFGLRFHCYDNNDDSTCDTNVDRRQKAQRTTTKMIWSFCVVYHVASNVSQQIDESRDVNVTTTTTNIQQWVIENMVQFTTSFRQTDVVWRTGSTLSCQYVFAPVIQQRLQSLHQQYHVERTPNDKKDNTSSHWLDTANEIIEQNRIIIIAAERNSRTTTTSVNDNATPIVSDESDCDDDNDDDDHDHGDCDERRAYKSITAGTNANEDSDDDDDFNSNDLPDYDTTSSSDEYDDDDELRTSSTPVRTGALPMNYYYCSNDSDIDASTTITSSYLDRMVASTTSIWNKSSVFPIVHVSTKNTTTTTEKIFPPRKDPNGSATGTGSSHQCHLPCTTFVEHHSDTKSNDDNIRGDGDNDDDKINTTGTDDEEEETIPLICFVGDQVDAQHSDLWKRSPKCITKSVALGITASAAVAAAPVRKQQVQATFNTPSSLVVTATTKKSTAENDEQQQQQDSSLSADTNPLIVFVQTTSTVIDSIWNNMTNRFNVNTDIGTRCNQATKTSKTGNNKDNDDDDHRTNKCFWCESVFPSKVSAIIV